MAENQDENVSFPYMTASCFTLIVLNLMLLPIDYAWKTLFPNFRDFPKALRRHDANLLLRLAIGPPLLVVTIYATVKTFQDLNWFNANRTFICYWLLIFLICDLFELSQRRNFLWQPYVHHIFQAVYGLYISEWSSSYSSSFPSLGLVIFSAGGRLDSGFFPLRRVSSNQKLVTSYAKISFFAEVFSATAGLAVMIALIIKYQDHLSLFSKIAQPIAYVFFQCLDLPWYIFVYKNAYGCTGHNKNGDSDGATIPSNYAPAPAN